MRNKFRKSFVAVFITVCILLTQSVYAENITSTGSENNIEYLQSVMEMIKENYGGEVTDQQLIEGALKGIFSTMDSYTQYMTNEEAQSFFNEMDGNFYGIGILMQQKPDSIMIMKVYPDSPAEKAGLYSGDSILAVNGKSIAGLTTEAVGKLIKGPEGKKVSLEIRRGQKNNTIKKDIIVGKVNINPVEYEIIKDIAYVKISSFGTGADTALKEALGEVDKAGVEKIILDLRDNPGGYVDVAIEISKKFIPKGLITKLDYKSEDTKDIEYESDLENPKYKLAVLVNGMSASASEIFAGAVQDTGVGTLIGTKTFGKAKVQSLIPIVTPEAFKKYEEELGVKLVDAEQLINEYDVELKTDEIMGYTKITTGIYTTPKGRMIDQSGLTPDMVIPDPKPVKDIDVNGIQKLRITAKPGLNDLGSDIYNAERILKLLGYSVDDADSFLDKKTFEAIKKFQKSKGGNPYGRLDFTTQKWLNEELEKLRTTVDTQYAKAKEVLMK